MKMGVAGLPRILTPDGPYLEEWQAQKLTSEEFTLRTRQLFAENEVWPNLAGPEVWRAQVNDSQEARSLWC